MDISTAHEQARLDAVRVPALNASLSLLQQTDPGATTTAVIELYGDPRPEPGEPPSTAPIVTIPLAAAAGTVDEAAYQLVLATPIEGQIIGADPDTGTIPTWARLLMPDGGWWADASVSVAGSDGEIQMTATGTEGGQEVVRLFNGAFARLTSAVFQG